MSAGAGLDQFFSKNFRRVVGLPRIRDHAAGVPRWFVKGLTNGILEGILEGINSLIQATKAKARGYRSVRNIVAIAYLIAGKLRFDGLAPLWGSPLGAATFSPT